MLFKLKPNIPLTLNLHYHLVPNNKRFISCSVNKVDLLIKYLIVRMVLSLAAVNKSKHQRTNKITNGNQTIEPNKNVVDVILVFNN